MPSYRLPGSICRFVVSEEMDAGTAQLAATPRPTTVGLTHPAAHHAARAAKAKKAQTRSPRQKFLDDLSAQGVRPDKGLAEAVRGILTDAAAKQIKLTMLRMDVNAAALQRVADAIGQRRVAVILYPGYEQGRGPSAKYLEGMDALVTNTDATADLYVRGALLHEAVHAAQDMGRAKASRGDAEVVAYVAQAMYYRLSGKRDDAFAGANAAGAALFGAAFKIADAMLAVPRRGVTMAMIEDLRTAVARAGGADEAAGREGLDLSAPFPADGVGPAR